MSATLNLPQILRARRQQAAADPRMVRIRSETNNARAALNVDEGQANLEEKNAFTMAQNAALLDRGQRPVGGGTYAEMRRRKLGPRGIIMSGLGAANRAEIKGLREQQIETERQGARNEIWNEFGINGQGRLNLATRRTINQVNQQNSGNPASNGGMNPLGLNRLAVNRMALNRMPVNRAGVTTGPVSGASYPTLVR